MKPLGERLLIKPINEEKKTSGGLILPNGSENFIKGVIVGVGIIPEGYESEDYMLGDVVVFNKYSGVEITSDGETYYVVNIKDVLLKVWKCGIL